MMERANKYNPKLDYLFCKYASSRKPLSKIDEEEWRDVYHELREPNEPRQEKMLRFKATLDFLKDPQCLFSMNTLLGCMAVYLGEALKERRDGGNCLELPAYQARESPRNLLRLRRRKAPWPYLVKRNRRSKDAHA